MRWITPFKLGRSALGVAALVGAAVVLAPAGVEADRADAAVKRKTVLVEKQKITKTPSRAVQGPRPFRARLKPGQVPAVGTWASHRLRRWPENTKTVV